MQLHKKDFSDSRLIAPIGKFKEDCTKNCTTEQKPPHKMPFSGSTSGDLLAENGGFEQKSYTSGFDLPLL
jgi:hypothetical protein